MHILSLGKMQRKINIGLMPAGGREENQKSPLGVIKSKSPCAAGTHSLVELFERLLLPAIILEMDKERTAVFTFIIYHINRKWLRLVRK